MPDMSYKVPLGTGDDNVQVNLPHGGTVELVCHSEYHRDMPAHSISTPDVYQTWPVDEDMEVPYPYPDPHGTFDMDSLSCELLPSGTGFRLEFAVPDRKTEIRLSLYNTEYYGLWRRKAMKRRTYTLIIRPDIPWKDEFDAISLPQLP